jgi:hypothetical protein
MGMGSGMVGGNGMGIFDFGDGFLIGGGDVSVNQKYKIEPLAEIKTFGSCCVSGSFSRIQS